MKTSPLLINGPEAGWTIEHEAGSVPVPGRLSLAGAVLWRGGSCRLGDTDDALALPRQLRASRKADAVVVNAEGYLPFGSQPEFRHACRYTDGLVRVTTDLRVPRQTGLKGEIEIGSLILGNGWEAVRWLAGDGAWTDWQALRDAVSWPEPPLAVELRHGGGSLVELGTGTDVWRWQAGFADGSHQAPHELAPDATGSWVYHRRVNAFADTYEPAARTYRFSWYAAWGTAADAPPPAGAAPLRWRDEDLDPAHLAGLPAGQPLLVDLDAVSWPTACRRTDDDRPCAVSHAAARRLRHVIRQLQAGAQPGTCIVLRGLRPGLCQEGGHLDRPRELPHWDMGAILDLLTWAAHVLGPDRPLALDPADAPSLAMRQACSTAWVDDSRGEA